MDSSNKSFLGTGWGFPPEFVRDGNGGLMVKMVSEEEDIKESLRILIATNPGERVMNPAYGCRLKSMMFDVLDQGTITQIKDVVERAVLFFEPRITLINIDVDTENVYEGMIKLQLNYKVRGTNSRSNVVYPFYFNEGTHVRI